MKKNRYSMEKMEMIIIIIIIIIAIRKQLNDLS